MSVDVEENERFFSESKLWMDNNFIRSYVEHFQVRILVNPPRILNYILEHY